MIMTKDDLIKLIPKTPKGSPKNLRLKYIQKVLMWNKLGEQDLFYIQKEIKHYIQSEAENRLKFSNQKRESKKLDKEFNERMAS